MGLEEPRHPVFKYAVVLCQGALVVLFSEAHFHTKPLLQCQGCVGAQPSRLPLQVHQQLPREGMCCGSISLQKPSPTLDSDSCQR